jgi:hypothetical protein
LIQEYIELAVAYLFFQNQRRLLEKRLLFERIVAIDFPHAEPRKAPKENLLKRDF